MFVKSIEIATQFTRSIRSILRNYGSNEILTGCSTCIIVNKEGWVLTCKHVTDFLKHTDSINDKYRQFKADVASLPVMSASKKRKAMAALEQKYGYSKLTPCTIQIKKKTRGTGQCLALCSVRDKN